MPIGPELQNIPTDIHDTPMKHGKYRKDQTTNEKCLEKSNLGYLVGICFGTLICLQRSKNVCAPARFIETETH